MYLLYNICHFGYWGSSAVIFIISTMVAYFINASFVFKVRPYSYNGFFLFASVIIVCYFISFGVAKPFMQLILPIIGFNLNIDMISLIAMFFAQCIYTFLNYLGQRYFAFPPEKYVNSEE